MHQSPSAIEPTDVGREYERVAHALPSLLLFAANLLFLWMLFASKGLERTAAEGRLAGRRGGDVAAAADEYAYLWRHGMVGGWPVFIPGFFAIAIAVAVWWRRRTPRELVVEGIFVLVAATVVARLLAPIGTDRLVPAFAHSAGATIDAAPLGASWTIAPIGWLTIVSWSALIVVARMSLATRSIRPAILPLVLYTGLAVLRPGEFGELVDPWARRLVQGDRVAVTSTTLLVCGVAALWHSGNAESRSMRRQQSSTTRPAVVVSSCQTHRRGS
jgi:hypothetical protein